jgi:hypothetical protein
METTIVDGLTLFFDADERETAELVQDACEKSIRIIKEPGLSPKMDDRALTTNTNTVQSSP